MTFIGNVLAAGGWAPLLVLFVHVIMTEVVDLYATWPNADMPMHVAGGMAMAFFASSGLRALVGTSEPIECRTTVPEAVMVGSLTTSAAVVWEFAEFAVDQVTGSNLQVSLANTMRDLGLGLLGALVFIVGRIWRMGAQRRTVESGHDTMSGSRR